MVDDNPNDHGTTRGQKLWRVRIRKENYINGHSKGEFSVRSALKKLDVPMKFKPEQVDPADTGPVTGLDPETERLLRADIAAKMARPSEFLLWPETDQHQVGWHAQASGTGLPLEERGTLSALSPRLGVGWHDPTAEANVAKRIVCPVTYESTRTAQERKRELLLKLQQQELVGAPPREDLQKKLQQNSMAKSLCSNNSSNDNNSNSNSNSGDVTSTTAALMSMRKCGKAGFDTNLLKLCVMQ
eukprot:TRINITY_DN19272_c1_g1_i2.p1 TRINITY_DN19272_c1_g1~~TRINITY_DN19272_c1_g1_i2.p1  ORF type:complete len:243 (-),score=54.06 TRINITY_DN19272_c1_g1_i2:342-1070(-)